VYEASDNSGVSRTEFAIDQLGTLDRASHSCDYTWAVPCGNVNDGTFSLDTSRVADGRHSVSIAAVDATGVNRVEVSRPVLIDNHAPAEPVRPSVEGGEGWHTSDDFAVQWTNPASAAPVTRALYEICRPGGAACVSGEQSGDDISRLSGLHVGQPGDYTIRVWLVDAAGNMSDAKSSPLHLKFDNVPPAEAVPQRRNGWINNTEAKHFVLEIHPPLVAAPPISGIAAYATTADGTSPGTVGDTLAGAAPGFVGRKQYDELPEGTTVVRARAISGAGIASTVAGSVALHVDRTAPRVEIAGAPEPTTWTRDPVLMRATASEPEQLSGLGAPATQADDKSGGFVEYQVDGESCRGFAGPAGTSGRMASWDTHHPRWLISPSMSMGPTPSRSEPRTSLGT
jgi:hypothetical protein